MSKNSPVVSIRIPPLLLAAIDAAIIDWRMLNDNKEMTRSTFLHLGAGLLIDQVREELEKLIPADPVVIKPASRAKKKSKKR